jgi:hypothetical protein
MKKIFVVLIILMLPVFVFGQKTYSKVPRIEDSFNAYYPDSELRYEDDGGLSIIVYQEYDRFDLLYNLSFALAILEDFYLSNNLDFGKFFYSYLTFYYINEYGDWNWVYFHRDEIIQLLRSSSRTRSEILQQRI